MSEAKILTEAKLYRMKDHSTSVDGVPFKETWNMDRVRAYTKLYCNYWIDEVYDYGLAAQAVASKTQTWNFDTSEIECQELEEYMWDEWCSKLEELRVFTFDTLKEFGLGEGEAHFLSIKVAASAISKFRLNMFIEFGGQEGKEDFQKTALRNAINYLHSRLKRMTVNPAYLWSTKAVDENVTDFCTEMAKEISKILSEETGAIIHAKLVL